MKKRPQTRTREIGSNAPGGSSCTGVILRAGHPGSKLNGLPILAASGAAVAGVRICRMGGGNFQSGGAA
jgi:hypothetical protein